MNPTFLDNMSWEMAEVYGAVSDQILINLAHYFPWYDESKLPRSTFAYQADMLAQMGKVSRDAVNIIHRNLDGADEALRGILEQAIIDSIRATNPPLLDAAKKGILQPAGVPIVAPNQMRAYSLYYKQAADKLNLVNTVMLESTQQAYAATVADVVARVQATQTALDIGAGEAITGVSSWNQATQHAIRRMADRGITGFIDHGGHRWSAEAYVAMDIRTTVANTARSAVWETNENFGNDLYSVSYHSGARPLCYPWQNKVISATDQARTVTDLDGNEITVYAQSDTTYGEAAGLFGINCKHYPTPFIPGVSLIRGEPQDKEANDLAYEQSQEQRRLERKLREDRRDLMMMKARGVPEEQIKAQQAKCEQSSQGIQDFCDSTGRARRRNREGVYTKRSFPAADTYDVTAFERTQQEQLADYFANGGAQQGYTFGQMVPNIPLTPAQPVANVASQATPQTTEKVTIDGKIDKLKNTLTEEEYTEVVNLIQNGETAKLYEKYGDACATITRSANGGEYNHYQDAVDYSFERSPGVNKYSTMAHEMAHMFDAKIGEAGTLTFNEVNTINDKCVIGSGTRKLFKVSPSQSDQFLTAMRKDKTGLAEVLKDAEELKKMRAGEWRNATGGVQDALDGFFGTQDKGILPWGHGNRYYNRAYNRKIVDFGLEDKLREAYNELGFGIKSKAAAKQKTREYETASELWANVLSALTCGGEELKAFKQYMPNTVKAATEIVKGLE